MHTAHMWCLIEYRQIRSSMQIHPTFTSQNLQNKNKYNEQSTEGGGGEKKFVVYFDWIYMFWSPHSDTIFLSPAQSLYYYNTFSKCIERERLQTI